MSFYKKVPGLQRTLESELLFDKEPTAGSTNPVTSDGVKGAIDGAVGDASEALQEQIDDIAEKAGSGYIPKGEATVATLNGLSGQENGELYTMTDAGTLTDGSLAVVAGDTVAWDATNSVWYKAMDYAPRQYGTNEVHNLPTTITAFRTGDYIVVDGTDTAKMTKDNLLQVTAENAVNSGVAASGDTMREVVQSANSVTSVLTATTIGSMQLKNDGTYSSHSTRKVVYSAIDSGKLYRVRIGAQYNGSPIVIGIGANVPALDQTATVLTSHTSTDTSEYIYDLEASSSGYLVLSCDVRIAGNSIQLAEISYLGKLKNQEQIIAEEIAKSCTPTSNTYNTSVYVGQSIIHSTSAIDVMANIFNSIEFDTQTSYTKIGNKHYGHDSTLCVVGSIAYTAYTCNDIDAGDSPSSPNAYVRLAITDISNLRTSTTSTYADVARNGDSVGAETITSGAGVPNVVHNGGVLHIFFSAKLSDNKWYMLKREYTIATSTFGLIQKCSLNINGNTYDFSASNVHDLINDECNSNYFLSMNADWAESSGSWYANMCSNYWLTTGIIFKTDDLLTFEEWLTPDVDIVANFECALIIKDGYMYEAVRQYTTAQGKMRLLKINMSTKAIEQQMDIMDAGSRPSFCNLDGTIYLFHNINFRQRLEIIKIVEGALMSSYVICQGIGQAAYPSARVYNGNMYMTYTGASFTNVYIKKVAFGSWNISKVFYILKKIKENYDR